MTYGYLGTMRTQPGLGAEVVAILAGGADALSAVGCQSYVVGTDIDDDDLVVVSELWDSKEAHDESLTLPEVKEAIAIVMPMLTGEFTSREYAVDDSLDV